MADYDSIFKRTNGTSEFVVKPNSVNGPSSPSSTILYTGVAANAVAANTPLVLVGKGVAEYGQVVQNNLIYLMEHFFNKSRPIPPVPGTIWCKSVDYVDPSYPTDPQRAGMYTWDGSSWNAILINGKMTAPLNVNNYRITNVANAQNNTDALTFTSADTRYFQLTGGVVAGNITVTGGTVKATVPPVDDVDVATKKYVDDIATAIQSGIDVGSGDIVSRVESIEAQLPGFYHTTGGLITGNLSVQGDVVLDGGTSVSFGIGSGTIDGCGKVFRNIGAPVYALDATNKTYVDETVAAAIADIGSTGGGTGEADGVVTNGALGDDGVLTLTRSQGLTPVVVNGEFSLKLHTHESIGVSYNPRDNDRNSIFIVETDRASTVRDALIAIDRHLSDLSENPMRTVIKQTVDGTTSFVFAPQYTYEVWSDRLMIFVNGIKQYADTRAEVAVQINDVGVSSLVGITPQTYTQELSIGATVYTLTIDITDTTTYMDLFDAFCEELVTNSVPVHCVLDQSSDDIQYTFVSDVSGDGDDVVLATTVGQLIPSLVNATTSTEPGITYNFSEVGLPGESSVTIQFATAPALNALIEVIVFR